MGLVLEPLRVVLCGAGVGVDDQVGQDGALSS